MEPQEYFKYCPYCKTELIHANKEKTFKFYCPKCHFNQYINSIPVNGLIIHDPKLGILLVKRKNPPQKGKWDLTGGFVSINETIEQSIIREAKEELGIDITKFKYLKSYPQRYYYKYTNLYLLAFIYVLKTDISKLKIQPDDDVESAEVFPINKIPWDDIAFEGIKRSLRDYIETLSA